MKKLLQKLKSRKNKGDQNQNQMDSEIKAPEVKESQAKSTESPFLSAIFTTSRWLQLKFQPVARKVNWSVIRVAGLILALSFVAASSVSTFAVSAVMMVGGKPSVGEGRAGLISGKQAKTSDDSGLGSSQIEKSILARNLFNSSGELAPEAEREVDKSEQTSGLDFEGVPCSSENLPIAVLGTIYTGDPFSSFVTVKDPKVSYADTYKVGSLIIDYEDYELHKVNRDKVEFRKGDIKVCVSINVIGAKKDSGKGGSSTDQVAVKPENIVNLEFEAEVLANGIGPGYANILNSAKLIPALEGGNVIGFKLIAIKPDSLFKKLQLQNGDIITEVNGVSLQDASEGFKLYQALQEEREITIRVVRGGVVMTYMVRVK